MLPPTYTGFVWCNSANTPGWPSSVVPSTLWASAPRSGVQTSDTVSTASTIPSGWRSATRLPASSVSASSSVTSNVIGIGHSDPSASRIFSQTPS